MTDYEVENIKEELKAYRKLLSIEQRYKDRLDLMFYDLTGVKGVSFDMKGGSSNLLHKEQIRLEKIDEYEELMEIYNSLVERIQAIEDVLRRMSVEDREMFLMKYKEGKSFYAVGRAMYMSKSGVIYHMNNVLKRVAL